MQLVVLELLGGKEGWLLWTLRMPPGTFSYLLVPTRTYSYLLVRHAVRAAASTKP